MKKLLAMAVTAAFTVSMLAGCGQSAETTDASAQETAQETETEAADEETAGHYCTGSTENRPETGKRQGKGTFVRECKEACSRRHPIPVSGYGVFQLHGCDLEYNQ